MYFLSNTGLVAVTSGAGYFQPFDSFIIGSLGCIANTLIAPFLDSLRIDDPVGAVAVHAGGGIVLTSQVYPNEMK
jgi:Amt family ammonium transporter